jgi:peptidyl-prolyl cis-trans isomerase SurA
MKKNLFSISLLMLATCAYAQNVKQQTSLEKVNQSKSQANIAPNQKAVVADPILLTVGGDPVTKSEFEAIYRKNNTKEQSADKKALEEYLELFINFKLKVKAAREEGRDTGNAFINELKGYRKQLAQPYLADKDVNERLINEAYERMKKDVKASHILIKLPNDPLPKDTLTAYQKAMAVRARVLKGESFDKVAREISDDPSAKQNGGDLGYFTSMMMVYPFESAAYSTAVGEISMPVKTRFGYHILKVEDIRDAQGQIQVAHIMVRIPENAPETEIAEAERKINELMEKVKAGEDFAQLALNLSDDRSSAKNGGVLPLFGTGKMVPEFEKAAFDLKNNGDISKPIRTQYGFHIIKRIDKKGVPPIDEVKNDLRQKISKDSRSQVSKNAVISRVKTENNFKEDAKALAELISKIDTSYLSGNWKADKIAGLNKTLFSIGDKNITQGIFASFLADNQTKQAEGSGIEALVRKAYEAYQNDEIIAFEDSQLENKYSDFRLLMQEYRDGILLFEITDEKVWSKALKDSAGLAAFHSTQKEKYMWGERVKAVVYTAKDEATAKATRKMVAKKMKNKATLDDIRKKINEGSALNLQVQEGTFSKGEDERVDAVAWTAGLSADKKGNDGSVVFVEIMQVMAPAPKELNEARGLITADYQTYLEKEWINELRKTYKVEVFRQVLDTIN